MVFPPVSRGDVEEKAAHQQDSSLTQEQHGSVSPQQGFLCWLNYRLVNLFVSGHCQRGCVVCAVQEVVWCLLAVLDY